MAALLVVGFLCNYFITAVHEQHHMVPDEIRRNGHGELREATMNTCNRHRHDIAHLILAWGFVGIPLTWGVIETVLNALKLFQ